MGIRDKLFGKKPIEKRRGATDNPNFDRLEEKKSDNVTCASCRNKFTWNDAYYQQDTPGSTPYHPPGHGDTRARVFCPYCGALVVDWHITRETDFDEWIWFGDNATLNAERSLPPSPLLYGWGKGIPPDSKASYGEHKIDVKKIGQSEAEYEARRPAAMREAAKSKDKEDINWENITEYSNFALSLEAKGNYEAAEKAYRLSIANKPKYMPAYNGLGLLLESQKRYDEAIETFRKAMEVDPNNGLAFSNLADLLIRLRRFQDAEEVYKKAMKIAPGHPITEEIRRKLFEKQEQSD